ncbi:MAG TPA: CpsB/CapC family capsule biosynthesis tyrosine phosphatase [Gaiellaceae bacterium]|nr:CpsB/CapC family capsule biosynthesis tyrosine phosphatase [Gaiellaceae bacterium]
MIDLHSHVLPGLDDGARDLDESLAIVAAAASAGIRTLVATPHVRDDYPTTGAQMESALAHVRAAAAEAGLDVELLPGGEIALDRLDRLGEDELRRFGLGGNPRLLLLEFPYWGWPLDLGERIFRLRAAGVVPLLAHPERNSTVQASPQRLAPLVAAGAYVQLTAASLDGRAGRASRSAALALLNAELAHVVASDAHAPAVREIGLAAALDAAGSDALATWLTSDVPASLLAGERPPPRPAVRRRRLPFRLNRG